MGCGKSALTGALDGAKDALKSKMGPLALDPLAALPDITAGLEALKAKALSALPPIPALPDPRAALAGLVSLPSVPGLADLAAKHGPTIAGIGLAAVKLKGLSFDPCSFKLPGEPALPSLLATKPAEIVKAKIPTVKGLKKFVPILKD